MSNVAQRRKRERAERRDRILDAAQLVFWREGFEAAKMGAIAEAAQLGKGTLYLYFRDKDHLALGLATRHQQQLLERFERLLEESTNTSGLELLRGLLGSYAGHMQEPIEHLRMVMTRWATGAPFDPSTEGCQTANENVMRIFGTLRDAIRRAQTEGELPAAVPPERLTTFLFSSLNGALLMRLQRSCLAGLDHLGQQVMSVDEHIDFLLQACRQMARPSHVGQRPNLEDVGQ